MTKKSDSKKGRDIKKESDWRKAKYKRFVVDVEPGFAEQFSEKLEENGEKYSDWVRNRMKKYLEKK